MTFAELPIDSTFIFPTGQIHVEVTWQKIGERKATPASGLKACGVPFYVGAKVPVELVTLTLREALRRSVEMA